MNKFLLLLLFSCAAFSQRVAINEIDEFTGDKIVKVDCSEGRGWRSSDRICSGSYSVFLSSNYRNEKKTDNQYFYSHLNITGLGSGCLSEGKVIFLFEDGDTLECKQISNTDCNYSQLNGDYSLSYHDLVVLSIYPVKKFRVVTTEGYVDFDVPEKKRKRIMEHYALLNKAIN